jgi:GH35 family endo-1,4-beta-xylanase
MRAESLFFDAYRWAAQADPTATLCSSEAGVLSTLTLTNAEAYHNLVYRLLDLGVPVKAVCVQAIFEGEVDASTVKHRLDVLHELQLPGKPHRHELHIGMWRT